MVKNKHILIENCLNAYNAKNVKELSELVGIAYTTLNLWEKNGPSKLGEKVLELLIENKQIKQHVEVIIQANDSIEELRKLVKE